jgi:hypothetical protein
MNNNAAKTAEAETYKEDYYIERIHSFNIEPGG